MEIRNCEVIDSTVEKILYTQGRHLISLGDREFSEKTVEFVKDRVKKFVNFNEVIYIEFDLHLGKKAQKRLKWKSKPWACFLYNDNQNFDCLMEISKTTI